MEVIKTHIRQQLKLINNLVFREVLDASATVRSNTLQSFALVAHLEGRVVKALLLHSSHFKDIREEVHLNFPDAIP